MAPSILASPIESKGQKNQVYALAYTDFSGITIETTTTKLFIPKQVGVD
jgi:hypothetical protein